MADPRIALRALQQIRGGGGTPMSLARRAMRGAPQDYYDPEQEALDSLDEADPEAYAMPGDPYPGRPFDPGDEGRAAAIDAYNRGPKPGADMRGYMPSMDAEPDPMDPMEGMEDEGPHAMYGASATPMELSRGMAGARNSAEAVDRLGPIFAQLQGQSAYTGAPSVTTAPMGERYSAAGQAPQLGATDEELEFEKRRLIAGGY